MGLRLILANKQIQFQRGCRKCGKTFQKDEKIFSTTRSTGASSSTNLYHVDCARIINLTVAEIWWNRLTKYKRKTILIDLNLDPLVVEENYGYAYRLLPEEIKIQIDVRYYSEIH